MTTASFSVCCRYSRKSLFQFVSNHCNYLRNFFSSKLQLSSRHTETRSALSHEHEWVFINLESALGLRKNCTFAQLDLGQRFDWPGNARRIGMTGEVCTELRVAPKQQHGEAGGERRENTGTRGAESQECFVTLRCDPRTSRSFTRSPTAELQQTRSDPALSPGHSHILPAFCGANRRLQHWAALTELHCSAA